MSDYQSRMLPLLHEIGTSKNNEEAFVKLEQSFQIQKKSKQSSNVYLFCSSSDIQVREESIELALTLIKNKFSNIREIIEKIEDGIFYLSSEKEANSTYHLHIHRILKKIASSTSFQKQILQFSRPILNAWTEKIIRGALRLSSIEKINTEYVQAAVLSALLHPLRQNVGSCFATAPAIMIQSEQPEQLCYDLIELLSTNVLKRTFSGVEQAVPISMSWGSGLLNKIIEVNSEVNLWESSELIFCLESLQIINPNTELIAKYAALQSLFEKVKFHGKTHISLGELVKKILFVHYGISEADFQKRAPLHPELLLDYSNFHSPLTKYHQFEGSLAKAEQSLISFADNPLLKTWEYTVASFAETHSDFYKWNLYTSLGFDSKKPFSIANTIYDYIQEKMKAYEEKAKHHEQEYEQEFFRVKMLEKRVVDTENERVAAWARVEYQNHLNEFNYQRKMRDFYIDKMEGASTLLAKVLKAFDLVFPKYFQEVYDPSLQEIKGSLYEDRPAGFRLVYKHGRQDPSLWSYVRSKEAFVTFLKEFFVNTEFEIASQEELEGFKDEYSDIVTLIINLIQKEEFIKASFQRILESYQTPLAIEETDYEVMLHKPWCYISGGTMEGLLKQYYKRETHFTKVEQKVATPTELFAFVIDTIRSLPSKQIDLYKKNSDYSMLMYSSCHAFLFKPGLLPIDEIWDKRVYSFSWIRDQFIYPQVSFLKTLMVARYEIEYFLDYYLLKSSQFNLWIKENIDWPSYPISILEFRERIVRVLSKLPHAKMPHGINLEQIDSWIYQCFPLFSTEEVEKICFDCFAALSLTSSDQEKALWVLQELKPYRKFQKYTQSFQLYDLIKQILSCVFEKVSLKYNLSELILNVLREQKILMPKPFIFADTNWPHFNFAFIVSPATEQLELWRMNYLGNKGFPMHQWSKLFDEKEPSIWGILTQPKEYLSPYASNTF